MTQAIEQDHAESNADGWAQSIIEMVNALADSEPDESRDAAHERIQESVLSVMVRDGWRAPGQTFAQDGAEEYEILLTTGGPAARIYGALDKYGEPGTAELQVQDWFKPWTRSKNPITQDTLLEFARCFYFGE
jgi:hypothetical protein